MADNEPRVLIVDLNNFARYPTIAVGYLAAILRRAQMRVEVFSPLAHGVSGAVREPRAPPWGFFDQWLRYRTAVSAHPFVKKIRARLAALHAPQLSRQTAFVAETFASIIAREKPDVVLISTYLMYFPLCEQLAGISSVQNIPVLLGGPYFAQPEIAKEWLGIDGVAGIVGAEVEPFLPQLVRAVAERKSLAEFSGVWTRDREGQPSTSAAMPLKNLDAIPFPDYDDFPWQRYPNRIIPLITGRGCAWGACTFCSDVTSTAGRTFRSRSPQNVLDEVAHQSARHRAGLFVFTDLKLNSHPPIWDALVQNVQDAAPGAQWVGAVHVDARGGDELRRTLRAARAAGMVRLTTGLESGSQRVLDNMCKGTDLAVTSRFLHDARAAGISVRTTMILGYPGEDVDDVQKSASFVEGHSDCIERVSLNRLAIMTGTRLERGIAHEPPAGLTQLTIHHRQAQVDHHYAAAQNGDYRRAVTRLLAAIHRINSRPLGRDARQFEGVM